MANVRVFEVNLSDAVSRTYAPLLRATGLSGRANTRVARRVRQALLEVLRQVVIRYFRDGGPVNTGRARNIMQKGSRASGSTLLNVRGHILGPVYIRRQEEGGTIRPTRAKALAIPMYAAKRPDGTPKLPGPRSWKNVQKTFIFTSKKTKQKYIAYKGRDKKLVVLYVLVDSFDLNRHTGRLARSWNLEKPEIMNALGAAMLFEMRNVNLLSLAKVTTGGAGRRV